jgi:hypothetical protein
MHHSRRQFLLALGGIALAGCARLRPQPAGEPPVSADGSLTRYPFRRTDIEALNVPSLGVTLGDAVPGAMFLTHRETGHAFRWQSSNRIGLTTRGGRVIATRGLRRDLVATRFETPDPLAESALAAAGPLLRRLDLAPGDNTDVRYESRLATAGEEFVTILERSYRALRITEEVTVRRWQWRALNTYWVEVSTGQVIRSIQHYAPDSPVIVIDHFGVPA